MGQACDFWRKTSSSWQLTGPAEGRRPGFPWAGLWLSLPCLVQHISTPLLGARDSREKPDVGLMRASKRSLAGGGNSCYTNCIGNAGFWIIEGKWDGPSALSLSSLRAGAVSPLHPGAASGRGTVFAVRLEAPWERLCFLLALGLWSGSQAPGRSPHLPGGLEQRERVMSSCSALQPPTACWWAHSFQGSRATPLSEKGPSGCDQARGGSAPLRGSLQGLAALPSSTLTCLFSPNCKLTQQPQGRLLNGARRALGWSQRPTLILRRGLRAGPGWKKTHPWARPFQPVYPRGDGPSLFFFKLLKIPTGTIHLGKL